MQQSIFLLVGSCVRYPDRSGGVYVNTPVELLYDNAAVPTELEFTGRSPSPIPLEDPVIKIFLYFMEPFCHLFFHTLETNQLFLIQYFLNLRPN